MVSRRRILSRSRDDLSNELAYMDEEEDVWYQKEKLYRDHIQEVLNKWDSIDDEIWAKVIIMERNRRVAKAYARAPVITVNGSLHGFDGYRIGLCGFDNPMRDQKTEDAKSRIGEGIKLKMDDGGNILVKRVAQTPVFVKAPGDSDAMNNAISPEILKNPQLLLEMDKPMKLFDMKRFQQNVTRELKRSYPDRKMLEYQCITGLAFVRNELECLDCPIWVMIINVVAMDMLKSKLPPVKRMLDPRSRPRLPLPDEDPYSVAGSGGSGSSGSSNGPQLRHPSGVPVPGGGPFERPPKPPPSGREKPPKLPPREKEPTYAVLPKDRSGESSPPSENLASKFAQLLSSRQKKEKKDRKYEDPYYCGFSARVSSFARPRNERKQNAPLPSLPVGAHSQMWHSRSYDSGMASLSYGGYQRMSSEGSEIYGHLRDPKYDVVKRRNPPQVYPYIQAPLQQSSHTVPNFAEMIESDYAPLNGSGGGESPYERIYGRLPLPNRSYIPSHTRNFLCRDWE